MTCLPIFIATKLPITYFRDKILRKGKTAKKPKKTLAGLNVFIYQPNKRICILFTALAPFHFTAFVDHKCRQPLNP